MDENSCENETLESVDGQKAKEMENATQLEEAGVRIDSKAKHEGQKTEEILSDRCGSSIDDSGSGPSNIYPLTRIENEIGEKSEEAPKEKADLDVSDEEIEPELIQPELIEPSAPQEIPSAPEEGEDTSSTVTQSTVTTYDELQEFQTRVRMAPGVGEELATRRGSVGPPPSYSFVMKQKKKVKRVPSPDPLIIERPPPPTYSGSRGLYLPPEERICPFPSFAEPIWRSHSQPALCPRCGIIVLTTTHAHDSIATHVAALALCLFGCWPCCLLPYCMNICKNMYHHCPICQTFLGLYRPW